MRFAIALLLAAPVAAAPPPPHSGEARPRTAPEWSDVALFVMAAGGVWIARRAMVRRFRNKRED